MTGLGARLAVSFAVVCAVLLPGLAGASGPAAEPDRLARTHARLDRVARGIWALPPRSVRLRYPREIREAAVSNGLSPALLAALVRAESNFNPYAVSPKGALGLGQLMPATARQVGVTQPFDPVQNLNGSAFYLASQLDRFHNVGSALAAYHAGPKRAARGRHSWPPATRAYVARVLEFERDYRRHGVP